MCRPVGADHHRPGTAQTAAQGKEVMTVADWAPTVDISETEAEYAIKAELPEVKKEDVKVTVEDGVLTLQGERKQEKEEKGKKYHRIERSYGRFVRSFTLPDSVDESKVKADIPTARAAPASAKVRKGETGNRSMSKSPEQPAGREQQGPSTGGLFFSPFVFDLPSAATPSDSTTHRLSRQHHACASSGRAFIMRGSSRSTASHPGDPTMKRMLRARPNARIRDNRQR